MASVPDLVRQRGFTLIELLVALAVMALLAIVSWRGLEGISTATTQNQRRADAVLTLQTGLAQWDADLDAISALVQTRPLDWDGRLLRLTRRNTDAGTPSIYVVGWTLRPDAATATNAAGSRWHRWQSKPLQTRAEWQRAWDSAASWAQDGGATASGTDVALMPVTGWQVLYFRNNAWTPADNSDLEVARASAAAAAAANLAAAQARAAANGSAIGATSPAAGALPGALPGTSPGTLPGGAAQDPSATTTAGVLGTVPDGVRLALDLAPGDALTGVLVRDWVRPGYGEAKQ